MENQVLCKCGCGNIVSQVDGKVAREFYSDACRKRYRRSTPDKQSTPDTQPRTNPTPDTTPDNPMAVPGDQDYKGVCVEVDGQWIVRPEPEPTGIPHILKRSDIGDFRGSRPYYLDQDTGLSHLSCEQLHRRLSDLKQWQASPEYAERVYRLQHGLTSHSIPANMVAVL